MTNKLYALVDINGEIYYSLEPSFRLSVHTTRELAQKELDLIVEMHPEAKGVVRIATFELSLHDAIVAQNALIAKTKKGK